MARAKRPPKPPVSDRALYLWLSAVLGFCIGSWWLPLGLMRSWILGFRPLHLWLLAIGSCAVSLAVLVIAARPRAREKRRWWSMRMGMPITVACAILAGAIPPDLRLVTARGLAGWWNLLHFEIVAYSVIVFLIRVPIAWAVVWIGALIYRGVRWRFRAPGPNQCRSCEFDQSGLPPHVLCPECGMPWTERPIPADPFADRCMRSVCLGCLIVALTGVAIAQLPWMIVRARYGPLGPLEFVVELGYFNRSSEHVFTVRSATGRRYWVGIVTGDRYLQLPTGATIRTRLYNQSPLLGLNLVPVLEVDGLAPISAIREIIDAPPPHVP